MSVVTFVLALISLMIATLALGWNVAQFVLAGARPRARFVIGAITGGGSGLVTWPLEGNGVRQIERLAAQGLDPHPVIGVKVINYGRAPVRVERWSALDDGSKTTYTPLTESRGPDLPHDLPAGASATWVVDMMIVKHAIETTAEVLNKPSRSIRASVELGTGKTLITSECLPTSEVYPGE